MSTVLRIPKIPMVVLGKELLWYGNYSSPHTDPSAVTALRGCSVFFSVRVLLNSLEIAPSCRYSASRTSWCQCSEG